MSRKIIDSVVDVGFSALSFLSAMGAGAAFGSIGGPIGTILGAVSGLAIGIGSWAFQTYAADAYIMILSLDLTSL